MFIVIRKIIAVATGLLLVATVATAQSTDTLAGKISIGVNYLAHGESCGGGLPKPSTPGTAVEENSRFLLGRLRLTVGYDRQGIEARAVFQNNAVWGSAGSFGVTLYEGWVKFKSRTGLFAQVGRIALSYDDERIIGPNDFAMAALSHDVVRLGFEGHGHRFHAILGYNQNGANVYANTYYDGGVQDYKSMMTFWYHYDLPSLPLGASLLFMNVGLQAGKLGDAGNPPHSVYQQMMGGYVKYTPSRFTLEGAFYRQQGKEVNASMQAGEIEAWMASAKATATLAKGVELAAGYDYLSGDDYVPVPYGGELGLPYHAVNRGFNPLYGSHAQFYGIMDFFYKEAYINNFTPGLQNAFLGLSLTPSGRLSCGVTYHYMATATELYKLDRTLGHSVDLYAAFRFTPDIVLELGYTQMAGTETMNRLKQGDGDRNARWGWFSFVFSPRHRFIF